ncbi:hypothetical protein [Sphaerospermopsis sp. LEGE 08334]|uniref:hypothetical protein n=1 Tax=Sphaerospermopsis sp. LEGE 08334 TaxID=1828651 RepID=UPI00187F6535|nr:hypothetical protein [Sphaerospermopsis sp. LEGE 08334]MBE9054534.1 hypothetical protein [Sphaerospermopsis sp. LEGE 08334]
MQLIENNPLFAELSAEESVTANGGDVLELANITNNPNLLKNILSYVPQEIRQFFIPNSAE